MSSIRVLSQTLINQIAAGEVIVRMSSVAKELVENSIDAGATQVDLHLSNEARDLTVVDDGCGMDRDDAELALQRHATSKIRTVEDLFALRTRGFRGEALASIAAVSRMELLTRPAGAQVGTRILVEGGTLDRIEASGCPVGTRISIRDLFFNTPARLKFLKAPAAETNALMQTVIRQALAAPALGVRVTRDGAPLLELARGGDLRERFANILGGELVDDCLLPLALTRNRATVSGFIAGPQSNRPDRRHEFLFVNGRPFSSKTLSASLMEAFRGFLMTGRFPLACIFVEVEPAEVDFNVHPTKEEVRFQDERGIAGAIYHAVRDVLAAGGRATELKLDPLVDGAPAPPPPPPPTPLEAGGTQVTFPGFFTSPQALVNRAFDRQRVATDWVQAEARLTAQPVGRELGVTVPPPAPIVLRSLLHADGDVVSAGPGETPDPGFWSLPEDPEPLGQIAETYVLARYGDDLLLVDQHAAHERLRYLELVRRPRASDVQTLLVPITFDLPATEAALQDQLFEELRRLGFDIESYGGRTIAITATPADLGNADFQLLLADLLGDFGETPRMGSVQLLRDRILIRAACHSAIRAGQVLPREQIAELLRQMRAEQLSFTCPHGRPTMQRLTKTELDRRFRRIV